MNTKPIPENTQYCNSSSHTCEYLQIPIGNWNGRFDLCRLYMVDIDRDNKQRLERCEQCFKDFGE